MNLRRYTPVLLAASVLLSGATGAILGAHTTAHALTSVDELTDVNRSHWAFEALRDLVEKYDVIEGYPDLTFRGDRQATRWEMAAALDALVKTIGRDLARLGAEKADKRDLQTLARLQEEFRNELNALNARVKALEDRAASIEAKNDEQDNRLTLLEKTQLHGDFSIGFLSDMSGSGINTQRNVARNISGTGNTRGITDGMSAIGRLRLALDIPIKDETEDSKIGRGDLYTRLVAAFGRVAPSGGGADNVGPNGPFTGYSRIASDSSIYNDGFNTLNGQQNTSGGNTRSSVYVESAYYKQNFKSGIPVLTDWMGIWPDEEGWETTADFYVGVIPWRFLFDKSPYRGNELTQFQNTGLVNTPGISVNMNQPMVAWQWHQGMGPDFNADFTAGLGSINVSDTMDGLNLSYEGRLNYVTNFLGEEFAKPGSLYVGGYHIWQEGNTLGNRLVFNRTALLSPAQGSGAPQPRQEASNDTSNAFYVGWNQEWYQGIGTFVSYMLQNKGSGNFLFNSAQQGTGANVERNANTISVAARQALSTGMQIPMAALAPGWRDNDVLGVGYALIDLHEQGVGSTSATNVNGRGRGSVTGAGRDFSVRMPTAFEHVLEAYYKYQFTDSITVVPSVQFIFNRFGLTDNDFTTVLGVRTSYLF